MQKLPSALSFIDVETTGLNPKRHRVIEIGIIRVEEGKVVDTLETLVNPNAHVPDEIYAMTGISPEALMRAPEFEEISYQVKSLLDHSLFVAHNARFDYGFIRNELSRIGSGVRTTTLCTVRLSRMLFPGLPSYSLGSIIEKMGIEANARHRAFADAEVLWKLYSRAVEVHGEERVSNAITRITKRSSLPSKLPASVIDSLPESHGMYVFRGMDKKLPLYVGKSVNIRDRVLSHFSDDYNSPTDLRMSSQITSIDYVETAGEIGALIRESDAIKQTLPIYNKKLRRRTNVVLALKGSKSEYDTIEIVEHEEVKRDDIDQIMAVFKSRKQAKQELSELAKKYTLCPKLLDLEHGKGACFASQLDRCNGACASKEPPYQYNARFAECFADLRITRWPFAGPIVIEESSGELLEKHIIDNWCYLGSLQYDNDQEHPTVTTYTPRFDWDIYMIIKKAVLKNQEAVRLATSEETGLIQKHKPKV